MTTASAGTSVEEVRDESRFAALATEWNDLVSASESDIPFLRHEWLSTWWKHFGGGERLAVILVRRGGLLVLAAPLQETLERALGLRLRALRSMTNGHSYRFDIIVRKGESAAIGDLWSHIRSRPGWSLVQLQEIVWPDSQAARLRSEALATGCPAGVWLSYESPFLPVEGSDFEAYYAGLKPKFRGNLRNRCKRLAALGTVSFEAVEQRAPALASLPEGLAVEASGWKGVEGSAIAADPRLTGFYTDWAELAADRGWLRLHFLRVGSQCIAFDYSLHVGRRLYCLKIGYDPRYAAYSPGQLLKERILEKAFAEGIEEYDLLGPMMEAKADWRPRTRRHAWLFLYNRDPLSRLAHAYKFGVRPLVRRLAGR